MWAADLYGLVAGDVESAAWELECTIVVVSSGTDLKGLTNAIDPGVLIGRLGLTDAEESPLCASVRPPVIDWKAGT